MAFFLGHTEDCSPNHQGVVVTKGGGEDTSSLDGSSPRQSTGRSCWSTHDSLHGVAGVHTTAYWTELLEYHDSLDGVAGVHTTAHWTELLEYPRQPRRSRWSAHDSLLDGVAGVPTTA
jgi:hypothetical protein